MRKSTFIVIFVFILFSQLFCDLKPTRKIELPDNPLIQGVISFCVTEDRKFVLTDYTAGDLKVYNGNGKHRETIGRKGYGPNEFAKPWHVSYNNKTLTVTDVGQRKLFFYKRKQDSGFNRTKTIALADVGDDHYSDGNNIYIAGSITADDGISYELYSLNINKAERNFLFPGYLKYGLTSQAQYKTEILGKPEIGCIGRKGKFDIEGDYAYYVWEGDLKIFKIHLKTKESKEFGTKMTHYVKPFANQKLINEFFNRNGKYVMAQRSKMSYVKDIFATHEKVLVFYSIPAKVEGEYGLMMQHYTTEGKLVSEQRLKGLGPSLLSIDKDNHILYAYENKVLEDLEEKKTIYEYHLANKK